MLLFLLITIGKPFAVLLLVDFISSKSLSTLASSASFIMLLLLLFLSLISFYFIVSFFSVPFDLMSEVTRDFHLWTPLYFFSNRDFFDKVTLAVNILILILLLIILDELNEVSYSLHGTTRIVASSYSMETGALLYIEYF